MGLFRRDPPTDAEIKAQDDAAKQKQKIADEKTLEQYIFRSFYKSESTGTHMDNITVYACKKCGCWVDSEYTGRHIKYSHETEYGELLVIVSQNRDSILKEFRGRL